MREHNLSYLSLSKKSSKSWAFLRKYGIIEAVMKVIVKGRENRDQLEIFSIEGFVPADHLLRKIDSEVDFNHKILMRLLSAQVRITVTIIG